MKTWPATEADARFGDVMSAALGGTPQRVTRQGEGTVVVVSESEWQRLQPNATCDGSPPYALPPFPLTREEWDEIKPGPHSMRAPKIFEDD